MMKEGIGIRAILSGNIQGVGFRSTAQLQARQLNLVGKVCNLPNGNVEIFIYGSPEAISQFFNTLQKNTGKAKIRSIVKEKIDFSNDYTSFEIAGE